MDETPNATRGRAMGNDDLHSAPGMHLESEPPGPAALTDFDAAGIGTSGLEKPDLRRISWL